MISSAKALRLGRTKAIVFPVGFDNGGVHPKEPSDLDGDDLSFAGVGILEAASLGGVWSRGSRASVWSVR